MKRRQFLQFAALLAGSPAVPAQVGPGSRPKRIIIVGAGLAGLCSAYQLSQQGHQVQVLEGQLRAGGRVQTLREGLSSGVHVEAGAARIPDTHLLTMRYIQEFKLPLEPFQLPGRDTVCYVNGKRILQRDGAKIDWPLRLTEEEKRLGLEGLLEKYYMPHVRAMGKIAEGGRYLPALDPYDRITAGQALRQRGASEDAVKLLMLGFDPELGSAIWTFGEDVDLIPAKQISRIVGGNDRLPNAFAERLPDRIRYGCKVVQITQDEQGVQAVVERGGQRESYTGDRLIFTLPFTVAGPLLADARLSAQKLRAIREMAYTPVVKTFLQTQSRFWLTQGLNGFALSDLPIQRMWPAAGTDPQGRGVLHSYVMDGDAVRIQALSEEDRQRETLQQAEKLFPGVTEQYEGGLSKCWATDPWQKGAFGQYNVGQMSWMLPAAVRQEGRIHFAGEHTSNWGSWMQGALDSAHRVVNEVNTATT